MELVRTPQAELAQQLLQALQVQGYHVSLHQDGEQQVIHVDDPAQYPQAHQSVQRLLSQLYRQQAVEPLTGRPQPNLLSGGWFASMGPVTRLVLIACVLVFLSPYLFGPHIYQALMFPASTATLAQQPWRLLTPMLLHFGVLHILFNLLWWSDLGRIIERFQSSFQLLWVTLVTGAISNLAQFLDTGPNFGGLSGVVYGLLGYLWIYGKVNPQSGYPLRREIVIFMLAWLVICFVGLGGIVANAAHLAGLVSGCVLGAGVGLWRRAHNP
ncbi:MAG: rhomboid family intramembrane serine protease [Alcanivorax sp.]|nr:rhomboid family intramembrane serine protease [Alcanivorax sp.]